jgi:PEP-CTERM motif
MKRRHDPANNRRATMMKRDNGSLKRLQQAILPASSAARRSIASILKRNHIISYTTVICLILLSGRAEADSVFDATGTLDVTVSEPLGTHIFATPGTPYKPAPIHIGNATADRDALATHIAGGLHFFGFAIGSAGPPGGYAAAYASVGGDIQIQNIVNPGLTTFDIRFTWDLMASASTTDPNGSAYASVGFSISLDGVFIDAEQAFAVANSKPTDENTDAFDLTANLTNGVHHLTIDPSYTGAAVVPEPSTFVLASLGGLGLIGWNWRRRLLVLDFLAISSWFDSKGKAPIGRTGRSEGPL